MTENILQHLKVKRSPPTLEYLQELMTAYCTNVPWESVSKIIKKKLCDEDINCLRLENEFWTSAFEYGTGGTCYESNWAFFCFLQNLGFDGYLTINKIIDKSGVHSAIVIIISNKKYIIDIGYPTYAPIPVIEEAVTVSHNLPVQYRCTPTSSKEYIIENYPHPKPYLYHFTDIPVNTTDYLKTASRDYGEDGLFSDRIIVRKIINKVPTRFDSEDIPYNIHILKNGEKLKTFIKEEDLIRRLSDHFKMDRKIISQAFIMLSKTNAQLELVNIPAE
ncbi:MAG TPA: arylamine N-acetyltransferase [Segetibacter sp.]|jgi:arylamine N-acetyltransferase